MLSNNSTYSSSPNEGEGGAGSNGLLGSGLIEITALTTLIGSPTTEQLALGDRGAAGLSWVGMSMFGSISILKSCVAAATPAWLRETLGVRNSTADAAIGLRLDLSSTYMDREDIARKNMKEALGVTCESRNKRSFKHHFFRRRFAADLDTKITQRDIYAFDRFTMDALDPVNPFHPGSGNFPQVSIFGRDPYYKGPPIGRDWIGILLTLSKVVELYILHMLGAGSLWWVSGLNWFYFCTSAAILQYMELSRGYFDTVGKDDILSGQFPSMKRPAGPCKILLGVPGNFRHHTLWKVIWIFGIAVCGNSLVLCYILLSSCAVKPMCFWLGFQLLWLFCRSLFYHIATNNEGYYTQNTYRWEQLNYPLKRRVLGLLIAVSKYQMHVHPRESYSYCGDVSSVDEACDLLTRCELVSEYPLDQLHAVSKCTSTTFPPASYPPTMAFAGGSINITIRAIIGDTFLSSVAWFHGSKYTPMDLYDCIIIFLEVSGSSPSPAEKPRLLSVPAVRMLGRRVRDRLPISDADVESASYNTLEADMDISSTKGSPTRGIHEMMWYFLIPCENNRWIQVSSAPMESLQATCGTVMTGEDVTAKLQSGDWKISLENVEMVLDVLSMSKSVMEMVVQLFGTELGMAVGSQFDRYKTL